MPFIVRFGTSEAGQIDNLKAFAEDLGADGGRVWRLKVLDALKKQGTYVKNKLQQTTATWTEHSVSWRVSTSKGSVRAGAGSVGIDIEASGDVDLWELLDRGTTVKYGTPSSDFSPKTKPRIFKSGSGSGEWFQTRRVSPGIEPRGWTVEVSGLIENELQFNFLGIITRKFEALARKNGAK
jgi:hypothetical protein